MNKIKLLFVFFFLFIIGFDLHSQTIGESIADSNAYRVLLSNGNKSIQTIDRGTSQRMAMPILLDQSQLANHPGMGFGGANASATTGEFFGVNVNTSANFALADDFIVPPGEKWIIDSVAFFDYQTGSTTTSTINNLRLQIRKGSTPGVGSIVFGDFVTNRLTRSIFSGIYRTLPTSLTAVNRPIMKSIANIPALTLSSGKYWIEHRMSGTLPSGPFCPLRTIGTTHVSTGNGYQLNGTWALVIELDNVGNNPLTKGIPLIIYGTIIPFKAARVNGVDYNTLQEAIDAIVTDGDVVTLLNDIDEPIISITSHSAEVKAEGKNCTIGQLNIHNGKYLKWTEDTLQVTQTINNASGILFNKANIVNSNFTNTGVYKGTGNFNGKIINQNRVAVGN